MVNIHIPPLREDKDDIFGLTQALLVRTNKEMNRNVNRVSIEVMQGLRDYDWPVNVRELQNILNKSVAMSPRDIITADLLPDKVTLHIPENLPESEQQKEDLSGFRDI